MAKTRISITIDDTIAKEIEEHYRDKVKAAVDKRQAIPKLSNIYEDIIKDGWKNIVKKK
ncbi:MAG TPA: hypothetical protein VFX64_05805 [Candidatus Nitrosotalea sp.]|nr:hypothetical protein [Candidatus Nitrosotalea sp.]